MSTVSPRTEAGATLSDAAEQAVGRAQAKAKDAIGATRQATDAAMAKLADGVDQAAQEVPDAIARISAQVEDLTRRSLDKARQTSAQVRERVAQVSDRTAERIRDDPMKSVLIAAATGAAVAAVIGLLNSRRRY